MKTKRQDYRDYQWMAELREEAAQRARQAHALLKTEQDIMDALCLGTRWRKVTGVKLVLGRVYVIRRIWADQSRGKVAVCRWDNSGWTTLYGIFLASTARVSAEVWTD